MVLPRLKAGARAGYNMFTHAFGRPLGWAYGRLLFTRRSHRNCYLPMSLALSCFKDALTMDVDPRQISRRVPYPFRATQRDFSPFFVWNGDWDVEAEWIDDDQRFTDMSELASNGVYRTTPAYTRMVIAATEGRPEWRQKVLLRSVREIDEYFESKVRLLASLRSAGYQSQAQLARRGDEIGIAVGRNGELLKYFHGHHRLALSKEIGLDSVTVTVQMVHHMWIERCCARYNGDPLAAIRKGLADLAMANPPSAPTPRTRSSRRGESSDG